MKPAQTIKLAYRDAVDAKGRPCFELFNERSGKVVGTFSLYTDMLAHAMMLQAVGKAMGHDVDLQPGRPL